MSRLWVEVKLLFPTVGLYPSRSPFPFLAVIKVWEQNSSMGRMQKPLAGVPPLGMSCLGLQE